MITSAVPSSPNDEDTEGRRARRHVHSPALIALTVLATLGILTYAAFLLDPRNRGDLLPWLIVVTAEGVLVFHALLAMWTIFSAGKDPRNYRYWNTRDGMQESIDAGSALAMGPTAVSVDVLVTVYGEPVDVVRRTIEAALAMQGRHVTWLLDDGDSDAMRDLAKELGCQYLRRIDHSGAKAGNINHALTQTQGDFFCIFDADFVPHPEFLHEVLPFFADESIAFVQTPQTYGEMQTMIARGAAYMQTMFYRFIQPGRNHFNAAFCVGTNVMFRTRAVSELGGLWTESKSEDVWTSLKLHERGWRSVYLPRSLAVGSAPETIEDYSKQQLRWSTGGFEILFRSNPFSPRRKLTLDQRIMYGVTSTHYLTGIAPGLLLLVPPLEIFLGLRPVDLSVGPWHWVAMYAGFYVLQVLLAFATLGSFRWEVLMLAAVSFPIYVRALVNVVLRREQKWHVTGAARTGASPFNFIVPQLLTWTFLLLTSVVALSQTSRTGTLTLGAAWNFTNTAVLTVFIRVAWREAQRKKQSRRPRALASHAVVAQGVNS